MVNESREQSGAAAPEADLRTAELPLLGMHCAACANRIEQTLKQAPASGANVNFATTRATVHYDPAQTNPSRSARRRSFGRIRRDCSDVFG